MGIAQIMVNHAESHFCTFLELKLFNFGVPNRLYLHALSAITMFQEVE